jgi:hypothetical protein
MKSFIPNKITFPGKNTFKSFYQLKKDSDKINLDNLSMERITQTETFFQGLILSMPESYNHADEIFATFASRVFETENKTIKTEISEKNQKKIDLILDAAKNNSTIILENLLNNFLKEIIEGRIDDDASSSINLLLSHPVYGKKLNQFFEIVTFEIMKENLKALI